MNKKAGDDLLGKNLGTYLLEKEIGRGGMGTVYKALDTLHGEQTVAIKVLPRELMRQPDFAKRFRREAKTVRRLNHPNIIKVLDFVLEEEISYIVMEYLEGQTLSQRLRKLHKRGERMSPSEIVDIVTQVAEALDYAHSQGVVHRDIKPSNIFLTKTGRAVLTDFGLVRLTRQESALTKSASYTDTGDLLGTPQYMAPEQAIDPRNACPQSDIYSLGVTIYEMASGKLPFTGDSGINIILQHIGESPPPLRKFDRQLPAGVEKVVLKALEKEPQSRFSTAGEMARALRLAWKTELESPSTQPEKESTDTSRRRWSPLALAILGLALLFFLYFGISLSLQKGGSSPGAEQATPVTPSPLVALSPPVTPSPSLPDFKISSFGLLPRRKAKCDDLIPAIHMWVVDRKGEPLNQIQVEIFWDGKKARYNSGALAPGYGKATLSPGVYRARVVGDEAGRRYTSEVTPPMDTRSPSQEELEKAGYCSGGQCERCSSYSYEVTFQKR